MKFKTVISIAFASVLASEVCVGAQPDPSEVLASYGNSIFVTRADFLGALHGLPAKVRESASTDPKVVTQVLDTILLNRVLAQQAREMGIADSPEVKAEMAQVAERALSVRRMEAFEASLSVPDYTKAANEQYEIHRARYAEPEQIQVAHVLIATKTRSASEAEALAEEVRAKAAAGADFEKLAKEYSEDPGSRRAGGSMNHFTRGKMVKEFEEAAFALQKAGDLSPVVKTAFGYHVIKLLDRRAARQRTFDEVKEQIIAPMRSKFLSEEKLRLTSKIRNDPSIKLNTAAIDSLIDKGIQPGEAANVPPSSTATDKR